MLKAVHEAKMNSSWVEPHEAWDHAVRDFAAAILQPGPHNRFLATFEPLAERLAPLGAINSLTQVTLKLTVPGMPDIYQGTELWDFSLVDPDNRRLPDYAERQRLLDSLTPEPPLPSLVEHWRDGRIKMALTHKLLGFRRRHPALFAQGSYSPLVVSGALAECAVAFERTTAEAAILVVVPRFISQVGIPPLGARWGETAVESNAAREWVDVLSGRKHPATAELHLSEILADFPVAVLATGSAIPAG
jgi:(1->4)-alpha-D-glucan 1-alpha-D-glucosylmutase